MGYIQYIRKIDRQTDSYMLIYVYTHIHTMKTSNQNTGSFSLEIFLLGAPKVTSFCLFLNEITKLQGSEFLDFIEQWS